MHQLVLWEVLRSSVFNLLEDHQHWKTFETTITVLCPNYLPTDDYTAVIQHGLQNVVSVDELFSKVGVKMALGALL